MYITCKCFFAFLHQITNDQINLSFSLISIPNNFTSFSLGILVAFTLITYVVASVLDTGINT